MIALECGCKDTVMCAQHEKEWWQRHEEARVRHHAEGLAKLATDLRRDVEKPEWDDM